MANSSITFTFNNIPVYVTYTIFNGDEIDIDSVEIMSLDGYYTGVVLDELLSVDKTIHVRFEEQLVAEIKQSEGEL